ncbi:MAG: STAS domain-containing protein [Thermotogota bacterium]
MEIKKTTEGNTITLELQGRLDTITSSQLEEELKNVFNDEDINLIFDFSALDYISSSGLRVLLSAQKKINAMGTKMKIVGANEVVKEIFDATGFTKIMDLS